MEGGEERIKGGVTRQKGASEAGNKEREGTSEKGGQGGRLWGDEGDRQ